MKKITLILFTIICFFNISILSAKTVNDVACDYKINNPSGDLMTEAQIQIIGYNDGTGGTVKVYFKDVNGKYVQYTSPTYDWQNYANTNTYPSVMLRFFTTDKKGTTYISNYKKNSRCPVIYTNVSSDATTIDVENYVLDQTLIDATSETLEAFSERLKTTGEDWKSREEFYKDASGTTTVKNDLVCNYEMNFDMYNIVAPVEFRTMYNAANGTKTYRVSINGNANDYQNLNEDIFLPLGQGGSELVYVSSEQLKKIFLDGKCLEKNKIYHYYELSHSRYVITTDEQEAKDNGVAGRYENGDANNPNSSNNSNVHIQNPNFNIIGGTTNCATLLGPGLTKVLKFAIEALRIIGVIATIALAMVRLIPAVSKGEQSELNKAIRTSIWSAIVLIIIVLLPTLLKIMGNLFGFDTSCI